MAIPVPGAGRRGLVSFRLLGFPVTIHLSFVVVVLFLGLNGGVGGALLWLAVVTVSVIAHELGHALVAAPVGGEPRIDLYMLAGLTTWRPAHASRWRRVAVSVAGPGAGLVFGLALLVLHGVVGPEHNSLPDVAFRLAEFANIGWGLLNLLPMLPLDGGQVVLALMPGDDTARVRRTAAVSLGVAAVVALAALAAHEVVAAVLVIFFAASNAQTLTSLRRGGADPVEERLRDAENAILTGHPDRALAVLPHPEAVPEQRRVPVLLLTAMALLRLGRDREAQDVLLTLPEGVRVEPALEAAVLLANGQERLARERVAAALPSTPEWAVRELVTLLVRRGDDVGEWLGEAGGAAAAGAAFALLMAGDPAGAAFWGDRALRTGATSPRVAYHTALAYARSGDPDRALRALDYAAQLGWTDVAAVEDDADFAAVRALPSYADVRGRIAAH